MSSNQVGRMVRVKKYERRGVICGIGSDNRYEVEFADGLIQYRDWFSAEELEFLPRPSASQINESFGGKFKKKMDETSGGMTSGSEQKVGQLPKKPKKP